ncbi:fructose-1,6-bisphosphatase I [Candidatus Kryptonium thompsonii]|jgi:fructose-1,6-bisphosphatase I|uniref:Fructose-1,6-bisphosphatase class 1 n=2 Tax=Candidatus Kryptonium thompsonii TaxID=1633631 RepID=A0A0P1MXD8_9BACT|nr:class 1 fructose-bisphosphatase [Candidatus Kryptonium thompsoni]CUS82353.1 fructose-1,6-bisphosphatase I [Candidatus Kryptonium thompsoni]CUS84747.1 fructose-1,6-bisphosphatase I [Candidatus Kryptonium thompsoni]CUS86754.1 fructose-1,6-bisphosphatase I [Candidatus Kryptonium thompsoni]CUS89791.1 fructose-1,6-bisphosphatase I [Candidatus Kryptonium thompsoni]CUS98621.1 fructose-1,6-bisphosphatase I [Candidatus Kryptonium thompsoni]
MQRIITIERFIIEREHEIPGATGEFSKLLTDIALAAKIVWREVSKAGLVDIIGSTGKVNISGDVVQKLDEFANEIFINVMQKGGHLCVMASEESKGLIEIPEELAKGKYVLVFDPLDGSSNIDVNVSIGSIFGIFRRVTPSGKGTEEDVLQPGRNLVAAGYVVYGSSTIFVYTTGNGVHGFTLDPSIGEFLLSHENIRIPKKGDIYSVNEGYYERWDENMKRFINYLKAEDKATGRPYKLRYVGTLVADFHRTLLYGGIFMYPGDTKNPEGKLRLIYEAAPLAYVVEKAGGRASNGFQNILDIKPTSLHQRTPLFIGSEEDVKLAEKFLQGKAED